MMDEPLPGRVGWLDRRPRATLRNWRDYTLISSNLFYLFFHAITYVAPALGPSRIWYLLIKKYSVTRSTFVNKALILIQYQNVLKFELYAVQDTATLNFLIVL